MINSTRPKHARALPDLIGTVPLRKWPPVERPSLYLQNTNISQLNYDSRAQCYLSISSHNSEIYVREHVKYKQFVNQGKTTGHLASAKRGQ